MKPEKKKPEQVLSTFAFVGDSYDQLEDELEAEQQARAHGWEPPLTEHSEDAQ